MVHVASGRVYDSPVEDIDDFNQAFPEQRIGPDTIEVRIGFEQVQVIVHGLFFVHILITESQVFCDRPVAVADLDIPAVNLVVTELFNQIEYFHSSFESR